MSGILIVDDQDVVRQGIIKMLKEFNLGIQPIYEASNGNEAFQLACVHEPDIILVDIMMSGMNGLEFVNKIKRMGDKSHIIIISAYNDFEFAKKAIDLKVEKYILKPVTRKELYQALTTVLEHIHHNNETMAKIREQKRKYDYLLLYEYLKSPDIFTDVEILYKNTGINNFIHHFFQIVLVRAKQVYYNDIMRLKGNIDQIIMKMGCSFVSFSPTDNLLVYIFNVNGEDENIAVKIEKNSGSYANVAYIGASKVMRGVDILPELFHQAEIAIKECQFKGLNYYKYDYIKRDNTLLIGISKYNKIVEYIKNGMKDELTLLVNDIFFDISKSDSCFEDARDSFINLVNFIHLELKKYYCDIMISEDFKLTVASTVDFFELKMAVKNEIDRVYDYVRKVQKVDVLSPIIQDVLLYIFRHYSEDISLALIANEYNVNYNYLSTLFAKSVGIPFSKYLLKYRLERAKEFLATGNYKVYEVAEMVGFKDPKYFCKAFKKMYKIAPAKAVPKYPYNKDKD